MADPANLQLYQGDDYSGTVTVSSPGVDPTQVLNGYTAMAQIRQDIANQAPSILVTIGTQVSSPFVYLTIPHAQTETLPIGVLRWDLQVTSPAGVVTTLLSGVVVVNPEVTR